MRSYASRFQRIVISSAAPPATKSYAVAVSFRRAASSKSWRQTIGAPFFIDDNSTIEGGVRRISPGVRYHSRVAPRGSKVSVKRAALQIGLSVFVVFGFLGTLGSLAFGGLLVWPVTAVLYLAGLLLDLSEIGLVGILLSAFLGNGLVAWLIWMSLWGLSSILPSENSSHSQ